MYRSEPHLSLNEQAVQVAQRRGESFLKAHIDHLLEAFERFVVDRDADRRFAVLLSKI